MLLLLAASALARYMQAVYDGRVRLWGEGMLLRWCGVDAEHEMSWTEYAVAALMLSLVTTLAAVLLFQPALMGKPRDVSE